MIAPSARAIRPKYNRRLRFNPLVIMGCLAGLLYSSWPLGFVLDPIVAHHSLASMLAANHEPYNWVFIATDVLTALALSGVAATHLLRYRLRPPYSWAVAAYALFGAGVGIAALTPLSCDPSITNCGPILKQPMLIIHGSASIVSVVALLASLSLLAKRVRQIFPPLLQRAYLALVGAWALNGVLTIVEFLLHITGNLLQYYFITACSLTMIFVIGLIEWGAVNDLHARKQHIEEALHLTE